MRAALAAGGVFPQQIRKGTRPASPDADIIMKKFAAIALTALLAAAMSVSVFAGEAKIKDMSSAAFQEGYPLEYGFDEDMNTRMSILVDDIDGVKVIVELDKEYPVKGLDISWFNGHTRFYDVEVSVSTDNQNWTVAFKRGDTKVATEEKGYSALDFDKTHNAKYIKLHCWGKTDTSDNIYDTYDGVKVNAWLTFWEMKVLTEDKVETTAPVTTAAPTETAAQPQQPAASVPTADAAVVIAAAAAAAAAGCIVLSKKKK